MSRFIFRSTPMCSSLLRREYLSSRCMPVRLDPPCAALYVSRLALDRTTMRRCESLSVGGIGVFCSATSCGRDGGGSDWVPEEKACGQRRCSTERQPRQRAASSMVQAQRIVPPMG